MQSLWESLTFDEYVALSIADPLLHARLPLPVANRIEAMFTRWRDLELRRLAGTTPATPRRLSVVMPVRNRAHLIHRPILSLRQQIGCEVELVLVDDASSDGTVERARMLCGDMPLKVVALPKRHGQAAARNIGIAESSHPVIGFLDADDWWDSAFGLIMTNALDEHAAIPVCTQRILRPFPHRHTYRYGLIEPTLLENRNALSVSAFVAPREELLDCGGFPEGLRMHEDWVLAARLAAKTPLHAIPAALSVYDTTTAGSVSKSADGSDESHEFDAARSEVLKALGTSAARTRSVQTQVSSDQRQPRRGGEFRREGFDDRPLDARDLTIVVVSFEEPDALEACLDALRGDLEDHSVHLLVIDNASTHPRVAEILGSTERNERSRVIRLPGNGGFTAAVNRAHREIPADHDLLLLNNDVLVEQGWLSALREQVGSAQVGLVVPSQIVPPEYGDASTHIPSARPGASVDVTYSAHARSVAAADLRNVAEAELRFVPLFCALIPAEVRELGLPLRGGLHYESDRFFCDVIRIWGGYRIVHAPKARVLHLNDRSGRALRETQRSRFEALVSGRLEARPSARLIERFLDSKAAS